MSDIERAIADGALPDRVWILSNLHCNLRCDYCLVSANPSSEPRILGRETMLEVTRQAAELGFTGVGVSGGEPFMLPWLTDALIEMSAILPVIVNTNGMLLRGPRLEEVSALADHRVSAQLSLNSATAGPHDAGRGEGTFADVVSTVRALIERGVHVRIASTLPEPSEAESAQLLAFVTSLGVAPEDHVIRPLMALGMSAEREDALPVGTDDLPPELVITTEGAFLSTFSVTIRDGHLDTDQRLTRTILPLKVPAAAQLARVRQMPRGNDSRLGIR